MRGMLRLDLDLSGFYERAAGDPALEWAAEAGAGRMMRSPTVFEDLVKTLCTTNCTWSATIRMVTALVDHLGPEAPSGRRAFPSAAAMAEAGDDFYKDVARAGYRGPYMRTIADETASGRLDLEALADPERPEEEVAAALTALPGIGPYATAHMMLILGRCSSLVLDSWTRPAYAKLVGRKKVADRTIERRFKRYRENAGLAFWLVLTRDWVEDRVASPPVPDPPAAQPASPQPPPPGVATRRRRPRASSRRGLRRQLLAVERGSRRGAPGPPPAAPGGACRRRSVSSDSVAGSSTRTLAHDAVAAAVPPVAARAVDAARSARPAAGTRARAPRPAC